MRRDSTTLATARPLIEITEVDFSFEKVHLRVVVPRAILFTSELPGFAGCLLNSLPSLWSTICRNDHGLTFAEELGATEMGHVLEHVVLALLMREGVYAKGMTEWNWLDEPEGSFHITLYGCELDAASVNSAIANAIALIASLLHSPIVEPSFGVS